MTNIVSGQASVTTTINGRVVSRMIPSRMSLADFLREELGLTGTHLGCEHGVCGACTVVIDGRTARSCLFLAAQAEGREIETIEGASESGRIADLQEDFVRRGALQCGFCTPGMLLSAAELLLHMAAPDRKAIRDYIAGNYCRCTGYHAIVDAIEATSKKRST